MSEETKLTCQSSIFQLLVAKTSSLDVLSRLEEQEPKLFMELDIFCVWYSLDGIHLTFIEVVTQLINKDSRLTSVYNIQLRLG